LPAQLLHGSIEAGSGIRVECVKPDCGVAAAAGVLEQCRYANRGVVGGITEPER